MKTTVVELKVWSGETIAFRARTTGKPPRDASVPSSATNVGYYAARVSERSGCEPAGTIPLERWRIDGGAAGPSEWSSVSTRTRREKIAEIAYDDVGAMAHLWTWQDGGKEYAYMIAAKRSRR